MDEQNRKKNVLFFAFPMNETRRIKKTIFHSICRRKKKVFKESIGTSKSVADAAEKEISIN